jgi:hypothetical protein
MLRGVSEICNRGPVALHGAGQEFRDLLRTNRIQLERLFQPRLLRLGLFEFRLRAGSEDTGLDRGDDVGNLLLADRKLPPQSFTVRATSDRPSVTGHVGSRHREGPWVGRMITELRCDGPARPDQSHRTAGIAANRAYRIVRRNIASRQFEYRSPPSI